MATSAQNFLGEFDPPHEYANSTFDIQMRFMDGLNKLLQNKANHTEILTKAKYSVLIEEVKRAKTKARKESVDYRRIRKYDIIEVNGKETLIAPIKEKNSNILYYVHTEELFDIIHNTHLKIGHGGRIRMEKELKTKYKNVTKEVIVLYLRSCMSCRQRLSTPKKLKPFLFRKFNSRCLVILMDMQNTPDGEYKFILGYQDRVTKFMFLRPLKSKTINEVAYQLLDIFTIIGAPNALQSDNEKEFTIQLVSELQKMWPELEMLQEKPKEGFIQRVSQDVQNMIMNWMQTNESTHWAEGLRYVQFIKNCIFHRGIKKSPYEALFGSRAKLGLNTSNLPGQTVNNLVTEEEPEIVEIKMEEDLDLGITYIDENVATPEVEQSENLESLHDNKYAKSVCVVCEKECRLAYASESSGQDPPEGCGTNSEADERKIICWLCSNKHKTSQKISTTHDNLKEQATTAFGCFEEKFPPAGIGDNVPDVDRGRRDPQSIVPVVTIVEDGFYKLETEHGSVQQPCSRSEFWTLPKKTPTLNSAGTEQNKLRSSQLLTGFQGCHCISQCGTHRCKCKKSKQLCNSKCHMNFSCSNK